jgi:F0F1-type ATP synthase membrane subunit a
MPLTLITTSLLAAADPLEHVLPHYLFNIGGLQVTNQMFMALVAAVLMLLIFPMLFRRAEASRVDAPRGAKNFFEAILEFLRVEVFRPALKENTDRFVPFLWTVFFFILFCNLLGQIPIGEIVTVLRGGSHESHLGGTATGTIATTGALALCTFLVIHFSGMIQIFRSLRDGTYGHHGHHEEHSSDGVKRGHEAAHDLEHVRGEALAADVPANFKAVTDPTHHYEDDEHAGPHTRDGIRSGDGHVDHGHGMNSGAAALLSPALYLWNFAPHVFRPPSDAGPVKKLSLSVADVLMWLFFLVLEMIGAIIKPFALMVRLFANMTAGHIVLAALVGLIPVTAGVLMQVGVGIPVTALSLLIRVLELFVAFLQAYIFTFLSTLFIASAVAPEH